VAVLVVDAAIAIATVDALRLAAAADTRSYQLELVMLLLRLRLFAADTNNCQPASGAVAIVTVDDAAVVAGSVTTTIDCNFEYSHLVHDIAIYLQMSFRQNLVCPLARSRRYLQMVTYDEKSVLRALRGQGLSDESN
jgi:hypothetical protein